MSIEALGVVIVLVLFMTLLTGVFLLVRKQLIKKPLNIEKYTEQWKAAQKHCAKKETWPLAIIDTDKILDDVLRSRRYKGKSMGERLMAAQHDLTNNDAVWSAHKLRNKLVHESDIKLTEKAVREALTGFRQALRDLGALEK